MTKKNGKFSVFFFFFKKKSKVVLCGGSIGSAQLLMLSGIGPRDHLAKLGIATVADLPVGEGLIDHVYATSAAELRAPADPTDGGFLDCTGFYKSEWSQKNEPNRGRDMQVWGGFFCCSLEFLAL
jgi:hypothetical protein